MHYIAGTFFTVDRIPNRNTPTQYSRLFLPGVTYRLIHIVKTGDTFDYRFMGSDNTSPVAKFGSARQADNFIAKHRKEAIPDYESKYIANVDRPD
jgi:hypothetical protein